MRTCALAHERETIRKRQTEGIAAARARGVRFGRPVKTPPENFGSLVKEWRRGKLPVAEVLAQTGLSEPTFYRRLREWKPAKGNHALSKSPPSDALACKPQLASSSTFPARP